MRACERLASPRPHPANRRSSFVGSWRRHKGKPEKQSGAVKALHSSLFTHLSSLLISPHFSLFASACFQGFSCCDANLRNEGCFFSGSGLSKLASEQAGAGEETTGAALASQQGLYWFWSEKECKWLNMGNALMKSWNGLVGWSLLSLTIWEHKVNMASQQTLFPQRSTATKFQI